MAELRDDRVILNAFTMNGLSHLMHGLWVREDTRQVEYTRLEPWIELAQLLEQGRFDGLFFADPYGIHDVYRGTVDTAVEFGAHVPQNDPMVLVSALAAATEHLGFALTGSIIQQHPFNFARQMTTLDHLTRGRVGWNIVSSWTETSWRDLGQDGFDDHDARYARADDYLDAVLKLWEGSWEDDAVVRDRGRKVYADPAKVHGIDHRGPYYSITGPHLSEPSPQRTPVLFQAGHSDRGRDFAARHAEGVYILAPTPEFAAEHIADVRRRAAALGRDAERLIFFVQLMPVIGSTEDEARRRSDEITKQLSVEGLLATRSALLRIDLSNVDPRKPLSEIDFSNQPPGLRKNFEKLAAEGHSLASSITRGAGSRVVGTPEQIADEFVRWHEAGVRGFNIAFSTTPGTYREFIEHVVPILQTRGLVQREYRDGTYREKLFGNGDRLPADHPGTVHRVG